MITKRILFSSFQIPIIINYKKIKHIYIRYEPMGRVHVNVNHRVDHETLLSILNKHQERIISHFQSHHQDYKPLQNHALVWGKTVMIQEGFRMADVALEGSTLFLPNRQNQQEKELFYIKETLRIAEVIMERYRHLFPTKVLMGVFFQAKRMKRSFGICYPSRKQIILNSILARFDEVYLTSVIIHELCHLIQSNHSKDFYQEVLKRMPNYHQVHRELKVQFQHYEE